MVDLLWQAHRKRSRPDIEQNEDSCGSRSQADDQSIRRSTNTRNISVGGIC